MDWYDPEIAALRHRLLAGHAPAHPVVFYGSSSFRLWTSLAADLGLSHALNLAFGGSTLAACVHFFDQLIPLARPASLLLYAGDNDLGDGHPHETVIAHFHQIAAKLEAYNPTLPWAFLSIKLSPARLALRPAIEQVNAAAQLHLRSHPHAAFIDVASPMLAPDGLPRPDLYLADGLHLSPAGYQLWAQTINQPANQKFIHPSRNRSEEGVSSGQEDLAHDLP